MRVFFAICFVKEAGETTSGSRDRLCLSAICFVKEAREAARVESAICFVKEAGGTA